MNAIVDGRLELARMSAVRSGRVSSWDQRGRNQDYWTIAPGETRVLADLEGPGVITHIWMTQFSRRTLGASFLDPFDIAETAPVMEVASPLGLTWEEADPDYYRKVLLRVTWDDQPGPSVLVPLGDFFGVGHSMPNNYESALFTVSAKPEEALRFGGSASLNSWVPMPFGRRALLEIVNDNDIPFAQYFHIDFELHPNPLPPDIAYFHASWRRENPCDGWAPDLQVNTPGTNAANLDGDGNYVVLEREGAGHYIGCNLSVFHRQGTWWGEGDDMIFIDDDTWPPSLHGTGTEDYFLHAWGMQARYAPYHGAIIHESQVPPYAVNYRFHILDPIRFRSRIKVTIEHGHANHLADDWASTAYWYEALPSAPVTIAPVADRLPTRLVAPTPPRPTAAIPAEGPERRADYDARLAGYLQRLAERSAERQNMSSSWADENRSHSRRLRDAMARGRP